MCRMGYADYCGFINQNERFDYRDGCDLWKEKLDYTIAWIQASPLSTKYLSTCGNVPWKHKSLATNVPRRFR